MRSGDLLRAFDEAADVVWIVHPFLFEAYALTIRLDWEHVEYRWVDASELVSYETVPKLRETFGRVRWDLRAIPEPLTRVAHEVDKTAKDRSHGDFRMCIAFPLAASAASMRLSGSVG